MSLLLQDLRIGARMLAKNPGFTALAILTIALGIGANSTIFSWISSTLLNPIPGQPHTADLVTVMRGERSEHPSPPFSYPDYVDLRASTRSLAGLMAYHDDYYSITGTDQPVRIYGAIVSANYFQVLGVQPIMGRGLLPAEEEKPRSTPSVIISYAFWQSHYGGDRAIIGKSIQINRTLCTIVGVAPPEFQGCKTGLRTDLWASLVYRGEQELKDRGSFWLNVLGRLKPGVSRAQAGQELNLQMQHIVEQYPKDHPGPNQITLDPLWRSPFGANVYLYKSLPMLLAMALALLLLASANVANLLLVRGVSRRREIALRLSLGASRGRLILQLMLESLLLGVMAGVAALVITLWTARAFGAFVPTTDNLPLVLNGQVDLKVLLVTMAISILSSLGFGMLPALRTSHLAPIAVLKEEVGTVTGGPQKLRLSSALVVAQIALSLLLLICAGLFTRSLQNAQRRDPGFDANQVLLTSYELGAAGYSQAQGVAFHRQVLAQVAALPGIESATLADFSPLSFSIHADVVEPEGYIPGVGESMEIDRAVVGPNYFHTLRTPLLAGREFTEQDGEESQKVVIVNQEFSKRYWPGQDPLSKRVRMYGEWRAVVGVARDAQYRRLVDPPEPAIFLPLYQNYYSLVILHARVSGNPRAYASRVEKTIHALNQDLPVFGVTTLESSMQMGSMFERIAGTFAGAFGFLALVLAEVGIYGVVSYTTRQRAREFAIRVAMGAQRGDVFRLALGHGLVMTLAGIAAGIAASLAATRYLQSMLFGITPTDVETYSAVALLLSVASIAACYIPARRATKVDPMMALRHQ